jgi:hypothetical protein
VQGLHHDQTKKYEYEEGCMIDGHPLILANSLMLLSENMYKGMKQNKTCNIPSPEDEKSVAIQAKVSTVLWMCLKHQMIICLHFSIRLHYPPSFLISICYLPPA